MAYTDSDYVEASLDKKSTTGGCQFLRCRLISWQCKKQTVVANSAIEAEYVAASSCCGQVLWIQNQLLDYGHHIMRDSNEKKLIQMIKIHTDKNAADLLTKAFDEGCLEYNEKATKDEIVYISCIERFWTTAKAKNINGEAQIHAKVDGKKVIISKASIRRDLRKGFLGKITPLFPTMMVQAQEEIGEGSADEAFNEENVSTHSNDPLHCGEDRLQLKELMELCTNLQQSVFNLETTKTSQPQEITSLKKRVKILEKKRRSRTHRLKRLYKVGLSARIKSSADEESLVRIMLKPVKNQSKPGNIRHEIGSLHQNPDQRAFFYSNQAKILKDSKFKDNSCHLSKAKSKEKKKIKIQGLLVSNQQSLVPGANSAKD
nr:hypothetical protein [Tanacetum cinerariifolium]